jgi:hypothetical protein
MRKRILPLLWSLALVLLANSLFLWGGLALTPRIGNRLIAQATLQDPLATTYLQLGRFAVESTGFDQSAREHAARRFSPIYRDLKFDDYTMLKRVLAAQSWWDGLCYYLLPPLLLFNIGLQVFMGPWIRTFKRRD